MYNFKKELSDNGSNFKRNAKENWEDFACDEIRLIDPRNGTKKISIIGISDGSHPYSWSANKWL